MLRVKNALDAYGNSGLEYKVDTASPHELICLLFEGASRSLLIAKAAMADRRIAEKGAAISKAIGIIEEGLRLSLDKSVGGELAANLDAIYEYMSRRLLEANLYNDPLILDEVYSLLGQLKSAWEELSDKQAPQAAADSPAEASDKNPRNPSSYGRI